jgi:pimeloyl-ACP methyl ester carboxylesterase
MTMQGWAGDCIALLNHLGIASAHVAGHSFGAGIALQMAIDAPGRVRKLALLEPPVGSLVPSGEQFTEWVASARVSPLFRVFFGCLPIDSIVYLSRL